MKKRFNMGLLVGGVEDNFSNAICQGVIEAAEKLDINLIIFPGRYIRDDYYKPGMTYEYQYNTVFAYANNKNLDVLLVCASCIACLSDYEHEKSLVDYFTEVPVVTISSSIEGYPDVRYDNFSGLVDGIEYIICELKKKKIGIITGGLENNDSVERFCVYKNCLTRNGISIEEKRIVHGVLSLETQKYARELLDKNPDIEAVVCANDDIAKTFYEVCKQRHIEVGKDILVMGYDDILEAAVLEPPLTTVRADTKYLGYMAANAAYNGIMNNDMKDVVIPSVFVLRESFGNTIYGKVELEDMINNIDKNFDEEMIVNVIYEYIVGGYNDTAENGEIRKAIQEFFGDLLKYFFFNEDIEKEKIFEKYKKYKKVILFRKSFFDRMNNVMDIVCSKLYDIQISYEKKIEVKEFFLKCSKDDSTSMYKSYLSLKRSLMELNEAFKNITHDMLIFEYGENISYAQFLKELYKLDINKTFLYLFEEDIKYFPNEIWNIPEKIKLKAYQNGEQIINIPDNKQEMLLEQIFNNEYLSKKERYTFILSNVFFNEVQYGIVLMETIEERYYYISALIYQISAAIRMIKLLNKQENIKSELEISLKKITIVNQELENISKIDSLTGIRNRRGFIEEAEKLLDNTTNDEYIVVAYADMDNLKIVNDKFGHEEGDYSLKTIGENFRSAFLGEIFSVVVGRIGGDEFAIVAKLNYYDELQTIKDILENVNMNLQQIAKKAKKEYKLHISIGVTVFKYKKDMTLEEMLEEADGELYKVKKLRKKEI